MRTSVQELFSGQKVSDPSLREFPFIQFSDFMSLAIRSKNIKREISKTRVERVIDTSEFLFSDNATSVSKEIVNAKIH